MTLFHGSIRKKLVMLVLLSTAPVFFVLIGTEWANRQKAVAEAQKEAAQFLSGFTEVQYRVAESTRALLKTISTIPEIRNGDIEKSRGILSTLLAANPIYTNVILLNIKGDVIAAGKDHEKARHLSFSDRKQFKDAIRYKNFSTGEFILGKSTKKPIFPFGMPVFSDQGRLNGAIIIGVNLSHYAEMYERVPYPGNSFFGICDHNGLRLFRYPYSQIISLGQPIKKNVYEAALAANAAGSMTASGSDGLTRIVVFEPVRLEDGAPPYMYMFLGYDSTLIRAKADAILYRMAGSAAMSLTLALAIAWGVGGSSIARHMENLAQIAYRFAHGEKTSTSGIDYKDGEIGGLAKSFDNMVEMLRKRERAHADALEQLRVSEQRFRELIEGVSAISIQGYDEQRRVTFWNSAAETIYGYTKQEAMGNRLEDLIIPPPMRSDVKKLHRQWIEKGIKIPASELTLMDKFGKDVPVFSSHVLHDTLEGKEMFCIDIDLKPLKESEAARQTLLDQLRQSQKMEALGTLSGGIAHDFNNILSPILGYSEVLLDEMSQQSPGLRENIEQIHASALRARQLVQQILTFSRQEKSEYRPTRIQSIAKEVIVLLGSTLPRNIEIRERIDPNCPAINANPIQVHQVLMNLATNASHAMEDTGGILEICLEKYNMPPVGPLEIHPGPGVCLTVSDTGSGMEPELIEQIFDPFFTTKEQGKGTGMGLSVIHGIVRQMDGHITVDSTPAVGTQFVLYFPLLGANESDDALPETRETRQLTGTESILLIDDEPAILKLEQQFLEKLGYCVRSCLTPSEALDIFQASPRQFDLVITDMSMPKISGDVLASKILDIRQDIGIILCTGFNDKVTPDIAQKIGIKKVLLKPLSMKVFSKEVRDVLDEIY